MTTLPTTTREVRRATGPVATAPFPLEVVEAALPAPDSGSVLVRTRLVQVAAPQLAMMLTGHVPALALAPGDVLPGTALGKVLAAPPGSGLRVGDHVVHTGGWREHAVLPATSVRRADLASLPAEAHLSQGWPAYVALTRVAPVCDGDVVLVTGGAGALGSLAGQVARLLGAGRVVGTTGSPEKARRMVDELGYDAVVLRGPGFRDRLAAAVPDGLDVVVDTVGGEQLEAAVPLARPHARFALVGGTSGQVSSDPAALARPVGIDLVTVVTRRVALRGMNAADHPEALPEWEARFGAWLRAGEVVHPHVVVDGIAAGPAALADAVAGRHLGTVLLRP